MQKFIAYAKIGSITNMVRLNDKLYDADMLGSHGIKHMNIPVVDCGVPTLKQVEDFYQFVEEGRTWTMIATFLIKTFKVNAAETVAFLRMMRPGSVFGSQTKYLENIQHVLRGEPEQIPVSSHHQIFSFKNYSYFHQKSMDQIESTSGPGEEKESHSKIAKTF